MTNVPPYLTGNKSQLSSTTIRALIVGIVALVGAFGVKWTVADAQIDKIAEAVALLVPLVSMGVAWYGRVTATRRIAKPSDPGPPVVLWLIVTAAAGAGGLSCQDAKGVYRWPNGDPVIPPAATQPTAQTRVDQGKLALQAAVKTANALIEADVVRDPKAVQSLARAAVEIKADLDAAQGVIDQGGDPFRIDFLLQRAESALKTYQQEVEARKGGRKVSDGRGAGDLRPGAEVWTPGGPAGRDRHQTAERVGADPRRA